MSESKPSDDASLFLQVLSKLESPSSSRTSLLETCLLTRRQPVYRRHELNIGIDRERENLGFDVKGNDKRQTPRERIPMQNRGAEPFIVAWKLL